ncbi:MAG: DUF5606 domain-containing protein [Tannerellaceae bacterium]|jgi:hypothetical protein|nr:DUF5606 domain-containing protein [Tannerellaceae bacterium]
MLKTIMSVSGKAGLFKVVSQGKNMLIVESLVDKKRIPTYARDKVISLANITVFTQEGDVPLPVILTHIKNKEGGEKATINLSAAKPDDLRAYLAEIQPDFDRMKVYPSDIRKMISWYNLLISSGITDFTPEKKLEEAAPEKEE